MEIRVKPNIRYLPKSEIESIADLLLQRYEAQEGPLFAPPVPIEFLIEDFLGYTITSDYLEGDALAYVNPNDHIICLNLNRSDYLDRIGPEFTLAHEIGHTELGHFEETQDQLKLGLFSEPAAFRHHELPPKKYERHEFQAEYFASCVMMPKKLLIPQLRKYNLRHWPGVYALAKAFRVSGTAMTKRLQDLGIIYVEGKKIYRSKEEANGQNPLI